MIQNNVVNHDNFDAKANNIMQVLGYKSRENIPFNYSMPNSVLNACLNSPEHKENLDEDYTHFGLSISVNPATKKKYYQYVYEKIIGGCLIDCWII